MPNFHKEQLFWPSDGKKNEITNFYRIIDIFIQVKFRVLGRPREFEDAGSEKRLFGLIIKFFLIQPLYSGFGRKQNKFFNVPTQRGQITRNSIMSPNNIFFRSGIFNLMQCILRYTMYIHMYIVCAPKKEDPSSMTLKTAF